MDVEEWRSWLCLRDAIGSDGVDGEAWLGAADRQRPSRCITENGTGG